MPETQTRKEVRITRDLILFMVGIGGIIHETFFQNVERPYLLTVFAAAAGLPAFLRADQLRRNGNGNKNDG